VALPTASQNTGTQNLQTSSLEEEVDWDFIIETDLP
jgi:hypothetical protein